MDFSTTFYGFLNNFFWRFLDTFFGLVGGGPPEYRQGAPGPLEHNRRTLLRWSVTKGGDMPCFVRTSLYLFTCSIYILYLFICSTYILYLFICSIYISYIMVSHKRQGQNQFLPCFERSYFPNEQWINTNLGKCRATNS